jgi:hypothetical protein
MALSATMAAEDAGRRMKGALTATIDFIFRRRRGARAQRAGALVDGRLLHDGRDEIAPLRQGGALKARRSTARRFSRWQEEILSGSRRLCYEDQRRLSLRFLLC